MTTVASTLSIFLAGHEYNIIPVGDAHCSAPPFERTNLRESQRSLLATLTLPLSPQSLLRLHTKTVRAHPLSQRHHTKQT